MATKKQNAQIPAEQAGIPRSHGVAQKLGYKKAKIKFADLSDNLKENFIKLADSGGRTGSLCGVGPSPESGYWLVCYKNERGQCNWVHVPKGSPIPDHV
jgi:hypothetical protein